MTEKINVNLWTEIDGIKYFTNILDNDTVRLSSNDDDAFYFHDLEHLRQINEMISKFLSLNGGGS